MSTYRTILNPHTGRHQKVLDDDYIKTIDDIADAISKKHTQNTDEYLNTQVTNILYVDGNRTDSYTENGSITKPFKTIQSAIDSITTNAYGNEFIIKIATGKYNEQIVLKNYVDLCGDSQNTTIISSTVGDTITAQNCYVGLSNLFLVYEGVDNSKVALRIKTGAVVASDSVGLYAMYTALDVENNGMYFASNNSGAQAGQADCVIIRNGAYVSFKGYDFTGFGSPYYDLTVEAGAYVELNGACLFYNDRINNLGTIKYKLPASRIENDSSVSGDTVKDALDNLLNLDQTTPQEIINGIPILEESRTIEGLHQLVDKYYVDQAVTSLGSRYYMDDTGSGIEDYKLCQLTPSEDIESSDAHVDVADDEYLRGWISPVQGQPTKLIAGVYDWLFFAQQTGGTGKKDLRIYWKLVERKADTSEVVIATSENSNLIGNTKVQYRIFLALSEDYEIASDSYVVGKVYADVSGTGGVPSVTLFYEGNSDSHWLIPINTEILNDTYEQLLNKVTSFQITPDDDHYPSEKLVKESLETLEARAKVYTFNLPSTTIANGESIQIHRFTVPSGLDVKVWSAGLSSASGTEVSGAKIQIYNEDESQEEYSTNSTFVQGEPIDTLELAGKDISIKVLNDSGLAGDFNGFIAITLE